MTSVREKGCKTAAFLRIHCNGDYKDVGENQNHLSIQSSSPEIIGVQQLVNEEVPFNVHIYFVYTYLPLKGAY